MMDPLINELAQIMFAAYREHAGGVTWDGKPVPTWDGLNDAVRSHWYASAEVAHARYAEPPAQVIGMVNEADGRLTLLLGNGRSATMSAEYVASLRQGSAVVEVLAAPGAQFMVVQLDSGATLRLERRHMDKVKAHTDNLPPGPPNNPGPPLQ